MEEVVTKTTNKGSLNKENNMTNQSLNKMAKMAVEDMEKSRSRLKEVQDACQHKETKIEQINNTLNKTCEICYAVVGYPTVHEIREAGYKI